MSAELKKCPCCNADAESDLAQGFIDWQGRAGKAVSIYCLACSMNITLCYGDYPDMSVDELYEMALNIWNRRSTVSIETAQKLADALKPYAQYQFATKDGDSFVVRLPIHANREFIQRRVDEYNESSGASNLPDAVVLEVSEAAKALAAFNREKGGQG